MPKLTDNLETFKSSGGAFSYSGTGLNNLGATEYTLATIVSDVSGSVAPFAKDMEEALKEAINSCKYSPRADNLMLRHVLFGSQVHESHGFKLLSDINIADYDNVIKPSGSTALFDASANAIQATVDYAKQLVQASFNVNGVIFFITDGDDNASLNTVNMVKETLANVQKDESLESLVTILIAVNVNDSYMKQKLEDFQKTAGLTQFIELKDTSKKSLAKLAAFVSKSISASSQALGTAGPSQSLVNGSLTI